MIWLSASIGCPFIFEEFQGPCQQIGSIWCVLWVYYWTMLIGIISLTNDMPQAVPYMQPYSKCERWQRGRDTTQITNRSITTIGAKSCWRRGGQLAKLIFNGSSPFFLSPSLIIRRSEFRSLRTMDGVAVKERKRKELAEISFKKFPYFPRSFHGRLRSAISASVWTRFTSLGRGSRNPTSLNYLICHHRIAWYLTFVGGITEPGQAGRISPPSSSSEIWAVFS